MNPRYSDAPVSPTRALTAPLSGISSAVLPMKVSRVRALPQHLIVMGALALSLCLLALLSVATSAQALVEGEDFKSGQVVVKLNPTSGTTIQKINADYGLSTLEQFPGSTGIYLLKVPAGSDTPHCHRENGGQDAREGYAKSSGRAHGRITIARIHPAPPYRELL